MSSAWEAGLERKLQNVTELAISLRGVVKRHGSITAVDGLGKLVD